MVKLFFCTRGKLTDCGGENYRVHIQNQSSNLARTLIRSAASLLSLSALRLHIPQNHPHTGRIRNRRPRRLLPPRRLQMATLPDKRKKRPLRRTLHPPAHRQILTNPYASPPHPPAPWIRRRPHQRRRPRQSPLKPPPRYRRSERMELEKAKSTLRLQRCLVRKRKTPLACFYCLQPKKNPPRLFQKQNRRRTRL